MSTQPPSPPPPSSASSASPTPPPPAAAKGDPRRQKPPKAAKASKATKAAKASKAPKDENKSQTNPLIPAAIAGLLALAGAFLLITSLGGSDATANVDEGATSTVLVVKTPLEKGTSVEDLLADPASFLSAKAVPSRFAAATAIGSVQELTQFDNMMLAVDILPGEQLLEGRFVEADDFERDSFIDRTIGVAVPEGHHQLVLEIPATRALGGNVRPGDVVAVISPFTVIPVDEEGVAQRAVETSLVVLNAVEVLNVQLAGAAGELAVNTDALGVATTGKLHVTLALTPDEITDLTYAMDHEDIVLAIALDGATNDDERPITTMETIASGENLVLQGSPPGSLPFVTFLSESSSVAASSSDESGPEGVPDPAQAPAEQDPNNADPFETDQLIVEDAG